MNLHQRKFKNKLQIFVIVFSILLVWFFSGGPMILEFRIQNLEFRIPPEIQKAQAATSFKVGSFTKPTATGSQQVTGVGFQPKAIIFFLTDQTAYGIFNTSSTFGFGFVSGPSPTSSAAISFCSESSNAAGNSDTSAYQATSSIVIMSGNGSADTTRVCGTKTGEAYLTSMNGDGFTLNWTTAGSRAAIIYYAAIGGADITNTKVGSFTLTNATGLHNQTGVGFKPDFVMLMTAASTTMNAVFYNADPSFSLGFSTNTTSTQANVTVASENYQTSADTVSSATTTTVLNTYYAVGAPAAIDSKTVFASMETDGFKLNKIDAATVNMAVHYLAIKGGNFNVGNFNQATLAGDQQITGVGFQPVGVAFLTNAASSYAQQNSAVLAFGAVGSATSSIGQIASTDMDADTTPDPDMMSTSTIAISMLVPVANGLPTVAAQAVVKSFDSGGFTMTWITADATARPILYFAIGSSAAAPTISCSTNVTSTAFGTLNETTVVSSSPNASTTISCSGTANGCTLYVQDTGGAGNPGLWNTTSSALIESPGAGYPATSTLQIGVEGYGIRATSTGAGAGTLNINVRYNPIGVTQIVGGLVTTGGQVLASSTANVSDKQILVTHKAAVSSTTPTGTYNDTITYSCVTN